MASATSSNLFHFPLRKSETKITFRAPLTSTPNLPFFYTSTFSRNNSTLRLCNSTNDDGAPESDSRQQELLARIAMLETQKLKVTDYLDDRSAYLTRFADEVVAEFDQIEEDAMKGLDEAGARIMKNIENPMEALEESWETNREEILKNEKKLVDVEGEIERNRNEGLFFKSLGSKTRQQRKKENEGFKKIDDISKKSAGSRRRRMIYLLLMGLLAIAIVDALLSSSGWPEIAILGVIVASLVAQFMYEQRVSSEAEMTEDKNGNQ